MINGTKPKIYKTHMKYINKDITTVESGVIFHCVNCQNVMGAGVAKAISDKYPIVKQKYHQLCNKYIGREWQLLGFDQLVYVSGDLGVVNLFGQYGYGRTGKHVEYAALMKGLYEASRSLFTFNEFYFPYGFASGLAGGDWEIVKVIIKEYFPDSIICKYER